MSGLAGTRTPNLLLAKELRYQLRHKPVNPLTSTTYGDARGLPEGMAPSEHSFHCPVLNRAEAHKQA